MGAAGAAVASEAAAEAKAVVEAPAVEGGISLMRSTPSRLSKECIRPISPGEERGRGGGARKGMNLKGYRGNQRICEHYSGFVRPTCKPLVGFARATQFDVAAVQPATYRAWR